MSAQARGCLGCGLDVEKTDYAAFAARVIRAHARRIADGVVDALADLLRLSDEVDAARTVASPSHASMKISIPAWGALGLAAAQGNLW